MTDYRIQFITNITGYHLGIRDQNWFSSGGENNVLEQFLESKKIVTLYATLDKDGNHVNFLTEQPPANSDRLIIFHKTSPMNVTSENLHEILQIVSLQGTPTVALYHTLNNVFSPLIKETNKEKNAKNTNLQRQLASLQAGLRLHLISKEQDVFNESTDSLAVILTLEHEVMYWNNFPDNSKNKSTANAFRDILEPLSKDFSVIEALSLPDVEDNLENAHNTLDDLWRHDPPYPKARMENLMNIVAFEVVKYISQQLSQMDVWTCQYSLIQEIVDQCISIGERWITICYNLSHLFWPNYALHPWQGDAFKPQYLAEVVARLQKIIQLRTAHYQLMSLLTQSEQDDLNASETFKAFKELDILECGSYTEPRWQAAEKRFEQYLLPAEKRVASKMKIQLANVNTNTRQLLYEFGRYSELISRPVVKEALRTERQLLITTLNEYLGQLTNQISTELPTKDTETSPFLEEITKLRGIESKAKEIQQISSKLLTDLMGYENFRNAVTDLLGDLKQQHSDLFDSWTQDLTLQIKNKSLSLQETDPVVQFSARQFMQVNYSPRLLTLISEVKQLSTMGYRIPSNIKDIAEHAQKFMHHAKALEQIADFHNTIGDRMITSQRPMMLSSALELSKLVQEQEVVHWGEVEAVEKYVKSLSTVVDKLSRENSTLAAYHKQILEKIAELEDTDLLKHLQKWKDYAKCFRDIMTTVSEKGFTNMHTWKLDIDRKICSALETQYRKSLDSLHLYLPEITADLIYRQNVLQLSPAEDILRERYNQQLKRFLDIPKSFRGVLDDVDGSVFPEIIERTHDLQENISKQTEQLFEQLRGVVKHWQGWLSLETLDTSKLTSWQHWELHFRASKTFGQEVAKLPSNEERVGCFLVGLSWLRSDLESHNRSYWGQLVLSLKDSIIEDVVKLQEYVDSSTATLHRQPLTYEQIGEAGASHAAILNQADEMQELYKEMQRKNKLLLNWTREKVDAVGRLQGGWERLQNLLENHQHIIAKQMETIKTTLNIACGNVNNDIERFAAKWEQIKSDPGSGKLYFESINDLQKHLQLLREKRAQWDEIYAQKDKIMEDYKKFNLEAPGNIITDLCENVQNELESNEKMWSLFEEFQEALDKMQNEEWIVFRKKIYKFEEFLTDWQGRLEKVEASPVTTRMMQEINKFLDTLPHLKYMRGEDFTDKHWMDVFNLLNMVAKPIDIICLKDFLNVADALAERIKELQAICKKAASEIVVRQALAELDQWDVQTKFALIPHTDSNNKNIVLIKDFKEILNKIGDNQSLLQSVKNSADYESFSERAGLWETRLSDLDHYLTSLAHVQRKWLYLEPIFASGTLIQEKNRFERLDKDFRHILVSIDRDPRLTALCRYPSLRSILENLKDQLSRCQHSLDNFLTEKRNKFPRFLFLGDDDLLEIVGQSSKEQIIQNHLRKLFSGIHSIRLNENRITAICSLQGETLSLVSSIDVSQPVEDWLNTLVTEMQNSLRKSLLDILKDEQMGKPLNPFQYPSQILCIADSINFTKNCENAISNNTLNQLLANYKNQLIQTSNMAFNYTKESITDDLNVLELKLNALTLDNIHHVGVIKELIENKVTTINDWYWQKQIRFYAKSDGNVTIKMMNATMEYSFEYLGNAQKLVRTPLTDQCFLTLTQGMHLGMGGNPYGPAGTGKTETVKALGALLGRQVLVFNCDEGIDAASMGRILSGLVRCGAWGCFDEFNRLDEATLSAVSMHIQPIQMALKNGNATVKLLDMDIEVNRFCGIFVTLNPAGGGYGGRNKLPDNLKQLFRPVVMLQPDHEQIASTLLYCDGYRYADLLGRKLVEIFTLSSMLLSKQKHYDWGLRALRTVLSGCGRAMKKHMQGSAKENADEDSLDADTKQIEMQLVVSSLRMDTLSKLTYLDTGRFDSLVQDVFPNVPFVSSGFETLTGALEESCLELGLQINNRQIGKCLELYEQLQQRMGVALVGPASSGKSTLRKILFNALTKMNKTMRQDVFNAKSMTRQQLLGHVDHDTRQWIDGVLTNCALKIVAENTEVWSWVICDGDVDPEWIESLNSVLDDNRLLTLPSGWRIQFGPNVNFIFETHDLSYASPATVSRLGIVFLSEEDLSIDDYVANWLSYQPENVERVLTLFLSEHFKKCVDWIKTEGDLCLSSSKVGVASTGLSQMRNVTGKSHFTVALINGLGGLLTSESKEIFAQQVLEWTGETVPSSIPVQRCRYNVDRDLIDSYQADNANLIDFDPDLGLPLIFTAKVAQTLDILNAWLAEGNEQHFLLVGPHGTAKSLILDHIVKERSDLDITTIYCSANITPNYILHKLSLHCMVVSSNKGRVYIPKKRHLILYFKHLHLLKNDQWGTNIVIAFLHQLITYGGFFDSSLEWVSVEKVSIVGTLDYTDSISTRFTSIVHFNNIDLPDMEELTLIVTSHLMSVIKKYLPENKFWCNKNKVHKITAAMISTYDTVKSTFTTIQRRHYNFSPHDLTKWCDGIARYVGDEDEIQSENWLIEVIAYEGLRIFRDKLVNESDRSKMESILLQSMQQSGCGKSTLLKTVENVYYVPNGVKSNAKLSKLQKEDWTKMVEKGIVQFGREGQTLDVLVIAELLFLTSSLCKALSVNEGCALLIGKSGVGRRTALRIASALQSAKLFTIFTSKSPQFNIDLKNVMHVAGVEGEQVYVLFEDHVIKDEKILDMVNTVLYSGEIPGLYNHAEIDSLAAGLKDEAGRENYEGDLIQFFTERIKRNLHVVVCLESNNSDLWNILSACPALCQKCAVIWQDEWSKHTLQQIPQLLVEKTEHKNSINASDIPQNVHSVQEYVRDEKLATPRRYVTLLQVFLKIYADKKRTIQARQTKLEAGVKKLTEAKNIVAELKLKAAEQQVQLAEKQEKANAALDMISNTMKNANTHKQEMETLKQQTELENEQLVKRQKQIELELAEVEPLIQEARAAVGNIRPEALSEIRSLRAPPDTIRDILEAVLRLMGTQDTSWNSMKTFLAKRGVKEDIRAFDAGKIYPENRQAVERLLANRSESFDPKAAKRASVAAAPLAAWVMANVRYSHVLDKIKPLSKEQQKLQQNLSNAQLHLGELSAGLSDVDATVAKLKEKLSSYTKEAAEIEIRLTAAQETLVSAEGLVGKLNDEFERWREQLKELEVEIKQLPFKSLLAAAFVVYLANETENERMKSVQQWASLLCKGETVPDFSLEEFLGSERQQIQWQMEGLSNDKLSVQNALIILNTSLCPLLLDSSSVALNWLKEHLKAKNLEIVSQDSSKFITSLELAIRFGKTLIVEEIDYIPPVLYPILKKDFVHQGERRLVFLNGKLIDYHADFQLYFCSRNTQLKLSADADAVVNIVNFIITHAGLTEQLLNEVIRQESPKLEERRRDLLRQREELEEKQYNLQNQLLEDLANSSGDILQNKDLLASLNKTKASSNEIRAALEESSQIQHQLEAEYDVYRDISVFGSNLYFAVKEFSSMNVLYTLSVAAFTKLFLKAIPSVDSIKSGSINIQRLLVQAVFQYHSRSLFKTDYLTFALHLVHRMFPNQVSEEEWQLFVGNVAAKSEVFKDPLPGWIPGICLDAVNLLKSGLPDLYNTLQLNDQNLWQSFMQSDECEKYFPSQCKISEFQRVLVIQCLRPDRLHSALVVCVLHLTGLKQLSPDVLQLTNILKESVPSEPVLFLIESGTDPSVELRELATNIIDKNKYIEIAMGEGQESKALKALEEASELGQWLTLKNLHLVTSWLPILCQKLQTLKFQSKSFRLWLVTEPHAMFNSVLAQSSLKIAYEAPQGIKINLHRSFVSWGKELFEKQGANGAKIMFAIACVHALLQERRTYIPQGWLKPYEFSDVDLSTAVQLCEETWKNGRGSIQWKHIQGLCLGAVYGGRIEHPQDTKVLETYLRQYFSEDTLSHRWRPFGITLSLPIGADFKDYSTAISKLGNRDLPSYFGLPDNIDRAWEKNTSQALISKLKSLMHGTIFKESKFVKEEWIKGLHPLMSLWKKLNQGHEWLHSPLPNVSKQGSPIGIFLCEEARFGIHLVQYIHKTFTGLNKIIKGNSAPHRKDFEIAMELLQNKTPVSWQTIWNGPEDCVSYLKNSISRLTTVNEWMKPNGDIYIIERPLNLTSLFNPAAFLSALKQQACRDNGCAMDELKLYTAWNLNTKRKGSVQITGLFIEGATFNGHSMQLCTTNSDTINSIPDCLLTWTPSEKTEAIDLDKNIHVPFYYTAERKKQLENLQIPCDFREKDRWIQAGVAVFLSM